MDEVFRPGLMRQLVAWDTPDATPRDAMNQPPTTSTARATYSAEIRPLDGRELMNAQALVSTVTHLVTMRNVGPIKSDDTLTDVVTGEVLTVNAVTRIKQQNAYLRIHCTAREP